MGGLVGVKIREVIIVSYTPTVWETDDIITAEKLNKIENGVKDANSTEIIVYNFEVDDGAVDADDDVETVLTKLQSGSVCIAKIGVDSGVYKALLGYKTNNNEVFAEIIKIVTAGAGSLTVNVYKISGTPSGGWLYSEVKNKSI